MPRVVKLDLRGSPPVSGGFFDHIPPGRYKLSVGVMEDKKSSTGKRMWSGSYTVLEGDQVGAKIGDNFVLEDNDGNPSKMGLGRLHYFLLCLALPVGEKSFNLDLDNLNGREFWADVGDDEFTRKDGSTGVSSKVTRYLLPNQLAGVANGNGATKAAAPVPADEPAVPADDTPFDASDSGSTTAEVAEEVDDLFK